MDTQKNTWFPIYINMEGKQILTVGGGTIACRRIRTLLPFDAKIRCIAPVPNEEICQLAREGKLLLEAREYVPEDLKTAEIVLACTDDQELNHQIVELARAQGIPVNNCSDQTECDFYFPSVLRTEEDIVIGINAGGKNHRLVKTFREKLQKLLGL